MPHKTITAPILRPRLAYPALMPMGLEIAIPRTNTFFATSADVELSESGNFLLAGKWPTHLDAIGNLCPSEFSIVVNSDGVIAGIEVKGAGKSDWIDVDLLDRRTLSVLLNAWTDEQIAKSSPGLFEGQSENS